MLCKFTKLNDEAVYINTAYVVELKTSSLSGGTQIILATAAPSGPSGSAGSRVVEVSLSLDEAANLINSHRG